MAGRRKEIPPKSAPELEALGEYLLHNRKSKYTSETERRLRKEAKKRGITVDTLREEIAEIMQNSAQETLKMVAADKEVQVRFPHTDAMGLAKMVLDGKIIIRHHENGDEFDILIRPDA